MLASPDHPKLTYTLIASVRETALALGYEISDKPGGADTIAIQPRKLVGRHRCDFLLTLAFHGASLNIAVQCDPTDFHKKTNGASRRDTARDQAIKAMGVIPVRFTASEINLFPALCADQLLNIVTDFQTARTMQAMAGAA